MRDTFFLNMKIDLSNFTDRRHKDAADDNLWYILEDHKKGGTVETTVNHSALASMERANNQFDSQYSLRGFKDVKRKITKKATFFEYEVVRESLSDKVRIIYFTEKVARTIPEFAHFFEEGE